MDKKPVITITTDFGLFDGYVGIMKGVILGICPEARIVDLSHEISRGDIIHAALILERAVGYFPENTVHCAVVDPGVGTERSAIAVWTKQGIFVGPDNGIFSFVFKVHHPEKVVNLSNKNFFLSPVSHTFHGRDIFAPASAHLACGEPLESFGEEISIFKEILINVATIEGRIIRGEIIHVDRFGNLITNIPSSIITTGCGKYIVTIGDNTISGISETYGSTDKGELVAVVGSFDRLEIAVNGGSASEILCTKKGALVKVIKK